MALAVGARLGPYEILSPLGTGGMGEVYRAHDSKLNRDVALKVLPDSFANDPDRLARFQREAQVLASLNHPNIAHIHGLEDSGGVRALVMELVEGEDLAQRILRGAIPIDEALPIAKQIAEALEAAHEQGIIHRDLKPANIKLRPDGTVKVLDFGLAKAMDPAGSAPNVSQSPTITSPAMTQAGTILGTAAYMSPEQARGKTVDKRADIWAFGAVLFEMLTGKSSFSGETLTDILSAVVKNQPDWTALPDAIPVPVRSLLRRCLQKDPVRRLQHAGDARVEIEEAIAEPAPQSLGSSSRRQPAWMRPFFLWALVTVLAATLLVSQVSSRRPAFATPALVRLEMNMPAGVEVATTSTPNTVISADGARIAFIGGVGGLRHIYVRRFEESEATMLRGTESVNNCFFSPDGHALGFITSGRVLKKISLGDGLVTTVVTDADYSGGGVWGTDDRIVFVRDSVLWYVPASGGPAHQLTALDQKKGETLHSWPTVVPGGKAVLFTTVTGGERTGMRIDAVMQAMGERHTIVETGRYPIYSSSGHLLFFRDNVLLAAPFDPAKLAVTGPATSVLENIALDQLGVPMVALSSTGSLAYVPGYATRRLVWVSRQGVEEQISDAPRPYQNPRLGPDGHRIVVEVAGGDLWIQDTTRATFTRLTSAETVGNTWPAWTPDARHVVFRTVTGLWSINPDAGGHPQAIPGTSVTDIPTSVSPDGQTLAFIRQNSETAGDIYVLSLVGDPKPSSLVKTQGYDGGGQFSPDGHWMAYVSNDSGPFEVYVSPYPGAERRRPVSTQGGTHPKWNRNGKELFYRNGNKMMSVEVSTRGNDIVLSQPRVLFEQRYAFGSAQTVPNYDVSLDGQRFVMVKDDSNSGRLNIVLNWFEELKRRVSTN